MTVRHHPSEAMVLDFAAGSLSPAPALAVSAHLTFCPRCRRDHRRLEAVGGKLLAESDAASLPPSADFDALLARIEREPPATPSVRAAGDFALPYPVRSALGCDLDAVPWKRLGRGAFHYVIPANDPSATVRLLRIPAGRPVPVHTHRGYELTLTLCGAYSDATGHFGPGDLQEADDSLVHQPHAAPGEDCICLAVTEAPLRFKSWGARLVQPLLGI